ncbi:MAG: PAC2 family protein, partial [Halobacteriales archaeon]|nr:PAC2 family protein [Halobacteriales archaeon]
MSGADETATFEQLMELDGQPPTLIEGLPGLGLVASIAVDQITEQLGLEHYGTIRSNALPPVASFEDGRVQDIVRVYAGTDPPVMTLQSDVPIPPAAFRTMGQCTIGELADAFDRAIFLAGAPASSPESIGEVTGVATTAAVESDLTDAGINLAEDTGLVGGVTGAIVSECFHAGVPAALLIVRADPYVPDPAAARSLIETALEPLVEFDIDTT